MTAFEDIKKVDTDAHGLLYRPVYGEPALDNCDRGLWFPDNRRLSGAKDKRVPQEFSAINRKVLATTIRDMGKSCQWIMEIGCDRSGKGSSTKVILENMPLGCQFFGVDIRPKPQLNNPTRGWHFLQSDSKDQGKVRAQMKVLGIEKVDLLFIDGWHSMNMFFNDWKYSDMLSDHGIIGLHDIDIHPGPHHFWEAIDPSMYEKHAYALDLVDDWGIGILKRKPVESK